MEQLSDKLVRSLEPKKSAYEIRERDGFGVRVLPSGTKAWFYTYEIQGTRRRYSLGRYPGVSLKEARREHGIQAGVVEKGIDPQVLRMAKKAEEQAAPTVEWLIGEYIKRWAKRRKRTWEDDQRQLDKDVRPRWGKRKAAEVTRKDVVALLDDVVARGSPIAANRLLACVRRMFNWAVEVGILEATPCYRVRAPSKENRSDRVLSTDEIHTVWHAWQDGGATEETRKALQFLLATAQRPGEVIGCTWEEIDGTWWTIPAERAKNGQAHRVPLSPLALEILGNRGKGHVFSGRKGGPLSDKALGRATARHAKMESEPIKSRGRGIYQRHKLPVVWGLERFSPHDLRRTAASHMTGSGISRLVVSKILNHAEPHVTATYDRHGYDHEKREALEAWSRKLRQIVEGTKPDNVVEISTANGGR